jgi:hypothetical protein
VIVLATLGAPPAQRRRRRKPSAVRDAQPEPVRIARATLIAADRLPSPAAADEWLERLRADEDALAAEVDDTVRLLNDVLHAHRVAALDPYARDVSAAAALVARVGYGDGDQVADGRFTAAYELPPETTGARLRGAARRREQMMPQERLAAILGGRDRPLAGEELLLRARADLDGGRPREAALQARIALEALLAELSSEGRDVADLRNCRDAIASAANAALSAAPAADQQAAVADAVGAMERALRRRATGA